VVLIDFSQVLAPGAQQKSHRRSHPEFLCIQLPSRNGDKFDPHVLTIEIYQFDTQVLFIVDVEVMKSLYLGFASGFANAFRYFPSELQIVGSKAIVKHVGIHIVENGHIAIHLQYIYIICDNM